MSEISTKPHRILGRFPFDETFEFLNIPSDVWNSVLRNFYKKESYSVLKNAVWEEHTIPWKK